MIKPRIIIAPLSIHDYLIQEILSDNTSLLGVSLVSFNVFLQSFNKEIEHEYMSFARSYQTIQGVRSRCPSLADSLSYPQMVNQLIAFTRLCLKYDIPLASLPQKTEKEKDIFTCVNAIIKDYHHIVTLSKIKEELLDASHIEIYPFQMDLEQKAIIDHLIAIGATMRSLPKTQSETMFVHYALNHALEAEALAQHVLHHQDESMLIICAETATLPLMIKAAFDRHDIPLSSDIENQRPIIVDRFLSLLEMLTHKSTDTLIDCIHNHVFKLTNPKVLFEYLRFLNLEYEDLFAPFDHISKHPKWNIIDYRDIQKLKQMEYAAEKQRMILLSSLDTLSSDPLLASFDHFAKEFHQLDEANQKALMMIKEIIEQVSQVQMEFSPKTTVLKYLIRNITVSLSTVRQKFHLCDLDDLIHHGYDSVVLVGANQKNYPGFIKHGGIIDESYMAQIAYPPLEERLSFHIKQHDWLFMIAPKMIISYATSTFDGKIMAPAFELFEKVKSNPTKWPLITSTNTYKIEHQLNKDISKELFFDDRTLYGSVSSFEVFFQCPYKYFLSKGLRLNESEAEITMVALMGTIAHRIVEDLIKEDIKSYGNKTIEEVHELVSPYFDELRRLFFKQTYYWDHVCERFAEHLHVALLRLYLMEKDTTFTFFEAEREFKRSLPLGNETTLHLKGYIDRIDKTSTHFRIVDYKSSEKNLSKTKVKAGIQLQLMTYLMIGSEEFDEKPSGAHYFSFLNKNTQISQQKIDRNKIVPLDRQDHFDAFIKEHKLSGWFVDEDSSMYTSNMHIKHITPTKKISKTGSYDLSLIREFLLYLYTLLSDMLLSGKIDRSPIKGACDYCEFKHICVFKDTPRTLTDLGEQYRLQRNDDA